MTDAIDKLIAQVEEMIADQEQRLKVAVRISDWSQVTDLSARIDGMKRVLSVIRLYEE